MRASETMRLKYAVEGCFNGVWGDEPNGVDELVIVRVADFDRERCTVRLPDSPTIRSVPVSARNRRVLRRGDLLIEKSGGGEQQPVGNVVLFDETTEAVCSNFVARMPVVAGCDSRYVAYVFRALYAEGRNIHHVKQTSGIQNLDSDSYLNERAWLPSKLTQERIANFLDAQTARIDALIAEKLRLQELLATSGVELLHSVVTKGLAPVTMKSSGREWIGDIPAHWSTPFIRFVARLESGHTPSRQHPEYWENCTIPWFSLADVWQIRDGRREVVNETGELVSEVGLANSSARLLPARTVMLSRTASVGFSAIMGVPMATTQDFVNWICGPKVLPEYLLYVFRSMGSEFTRLKYGSTHSTIYMPEVAKFSMPLPPLAEQKAIVDAARTRKARLDELAGLVEQSLERLREYRSSLISAAVSDQIDLGSFVNEVEKPTALVVG